MYGAHLRIAYTKGKEEKKYIILTYILSRTISKLLQIIGQIIAFYGGYLLNTLARGEPLNF